MKNLITILSILAIPFTLSSCGEELKNLAPDLTKEWEEKISETTDSINNIKENVPTSLDEATDTLVEKAKEQAKESIPSINLNPFSEEEGEK